ncbi:MAG: molybdenum cofactor guanylyltransferase [Phycisphaeraceae bacterium]|nr:molybdenum cofactor guanylyltransferase [Phycisphaeraceae bacterium]
MTPHTRCDLYILAGGQSSRFGSDKALADVDGGTMLHNVMMPLKNALKDDGRNPRVTLVTGERPRYETMGLRVLTDRPKRVGPIGGLNAALEDRLSHHGPGWLLLTGCDWVRPQVSWVEPLLERMHDGALPAIAYDTGKWEPMLALYHTDVLHEVRKMLTCKRHSLQGLLNTVPATRVPAESVGIKLRQANTPGQLTQALKERAYS